jgi:hypothetical protein
VASSADGVKLAAVDSIGERIYTSTNSGATWTQTSAPSNYWSSVASSADGTKLVAVSGAYNSLGHPPGPIYTSTNSGATWILTSAPHQDWTSVASSADGSKLVGCSSYIYVSTNSGAGWIRRALNVLPNHGFDQWISVAASADGSTMAAVSKSALPSGVLTSTNSGTTWNTNSVPDLTWNAVALSADGARLVATVGYPSTGPILTMQTTPSPVLNLLTLDNGFLISWIIPSMNFTMQQSSDLSSWTNLTALPILNLTNLQNQMVLPPSGGAGFYRLKH